MAISDFINLDKEDTLIEPKASLLQEVIKALINQGLYGSQ